MKNQCTVAVQLLACAVIILFDFAGCKKKEATLAEASRLDAVNRLVTVESALDLMSGNPILPVPTADPTGRPICIGVIPL